jgi:hypothetical protein
MAIDLEDLELRKRVIKEVIDNARSVATGISRNDMGKLYRSLDFVYDETCKTGDMESFESFEKNYLGMLEELMK